MILIEAVQILFGGAKGLGMQGQTDQQGQDEREQGRSMVILGK
ncbi:hypothetical protein ACTG11_00015 [Aeromonas hydrophila]